MIRKDLEVVVVRMYFHFGSEIEKIFFKNQFGFTYYKPIHFQFPPNNFNVKVTSIVTYIHTSKAL